MIGVTEEMNTWIAQFERLETSADGGAWFLPVRKAAIARFSEIGFPTTKDENWKYTNVAPIAGTSYDRPEPRDVRPDRKAITPFLLGEASGIRITFVNGQFNPELSYLGEVPDGVTVGSLAEAIGGEDKTVCDHLARHAAYENQAFVALNTALTEDGAFIHVKAKQVITQPIYVLYLSFPTDRPVAIHPRTLIVADSASQVTVLESHAGIGEGEYLSNPVTEIVASDGAVVDHYSVVLPASGGSHVSSLQIAQDRTSNVWSKVICFGGTMIRNDINTCLDGEGANCNLRGLYMVEGNEHVDNSLFVDHAKPHCDSREFFKGILAGKGRGIFAGRIMVREKAQKTDAKQTNQSLLLSEDAQVESKPQLEIFADDVKCTHGATIGQIDDLALFYLRSRGLDEEAARAMLIFAFAAEAVDEVTVPELRNQLLTMLQRRLPSGHIFQEAV